MEGDSSGRSDLPDIAISIHSLRMEGDESHLKRYIEFVISIHSLRMEGDFLSDRTAHSFFHFNPLPPHGGRRTSLD